MLPARLGCGRPFILPSEFRMFAGNMTYVIFYKHWAECQWVLLVVRCIDWMNELSNGKMGNGCVAWPGSVGNRKHQPTDQQQQQRWNDDGKEVHFNTSDVTSNSEWFTLCTKASFYAWLCPFTDWLGRTITRWIDRCGNISMENNSIFWFSRELSPLL